MAINNIKKRKEIVKRYQAYLDSIENIVSLDDLDIFRKEEADHEETDEPPLVGLMTLISGDRR